MVGCDPTLSLDVWSHSVAEIAINNVSKLFTKLFIQFGVRAGDGFDWSRRL